MIRRFLKNERGTSAVEYGLIVVFLSLVIIGGIGEAGDKLAFLWGNNNSKLQQGLENTHLP